MSINLSWTRLSAAGDKIFAHWRHTSGWDIHHCGHPTANWPYYLAGPGRTDMIVSFNGRGFKTLAAAQSVVERIVSGEYQITTENCMPNIACVKDVTAFGERLI